MVELEEHYKTGSTAFLTHVKSKELMQMSIMTETNGLARILVVVGLSLI